MKGYAYLGRIVSFKHDRHAISIYRECTKHWCYLVDAWGSKRYWKTVEDAEKYAEEWGIKVIEKMWCAL